MRDSLACVLGTPSTGLSLKVMYSSEDLKTTEFHDLCDQNGAGFVLVSNPLSGTVFGAFTRLGWGSQPAVSYNDREATLFLFTPFDGPTSIRKLKNRLADWL